MDKSSHPYSIFILSSVIFLSAAAGFINGLIGAGSGIIFMIISRLINGGGGDGKQMYGFSVMCVIPVSVISLMMYPRNLITLPEIIKIAPCAVIGGYIGAVIKEKINAVWLNLAFAALTVYSGISMIMR